MKFVIVDTNEKKIAIYLPNTGHKQKETLFSKFAVACQLGKLKVEK